MFWPTSIAIVAITVAWLTLVGHLNFLPCVTQLCDDYVRQEMENREQRQNKLLAVDEESRRLDNLERKKRLESTPVATPPSAVAESRDESFTLEYELPARDHDSRDTFYLEPHDEPVYPRRRERLQEMIIERPIGAHSVPLGRPYLGACSSYGSRCR